MSSTGLLAALGAQPEKAQAVIGYLKSALFFNALFDSFQKVAVELTDVAALLADEVMVVMLLLTAQLDFVAALPITVVEAVDDPQLLQKLQIAIHRGQADFTVEFLRMHVDLFSGKMVVGIGNEHIQNGTSLGSEPVRLLLQLRLHPVLQHASTPS